MPDFSSGRTTVSMRSRHVCAKGRGREERRHPAGALQQEQEMQVGFVVLYVTDAGACSRFWVEQVGMVEKKRDEAAGFVIPQVGFADQAFGF